MPGQFVKTSQWKSFQLILDHPHESGGQVEPGQEGVHHEGGQYVKIDSCTFVYLFNLICKSYKHTFSGFSLCLSVCTFDDLGSTFGDLGSIFDDQRSTLDYLIITFDNFRTAFDEFKTVFDDLWSC